MTRYIKPNYKKASNMMFVAAALYVFNYFLIRDYPPALELTDMISTLTLFVVMALVTRLGYSWVKWICSAAILLILAIGISALIAMFKVNMPAGCILLAQDVALIIALVLLFMPTREPLIDAANESSII